jgi:hypothetical protein
MIGNTGCRLDHGWQAWEGLGRAARQLRKSGVRVVGGSLLVSLVLWVLALALIRRCRPAIRGGRSRVAGLAADVWRGVGWLDRSSQADLRARVCARDSGYADLGKDVDLRLSSLYLYMVGYGLLNFRTVSLLWLFS